MIGASAAATLQKKRRLTTNGTTIAVATESKLPYEFTAGPVLAVWTRDKSLDRVDTLGAPALCAVARHPDNISDWKANWSPVDIRSGDASESTAANVWPVVEQALLSLTATVNVSTGLSHPSDRTSAVQMFKLLRRAAEHYDPNSVRAWAVQHGWDPVDARELADVAEKVKNGRALRSGRETMWHTDNVERWRAAARGESP